MSSECSTGLVKTLTGKQLIIKRHVIITQDNAISDRGVQLHAARWADKWQKSGRGDGIHCTQWTIQTNKPKHW